MKLFYKLVSNAAFAANLLLAFFLLVEGRIVVPGWLQAVGRMHPLLLHLPIGLLLLVAVLPVLWRYVDRASLHQIQLFVLAGATLTAALTAVMGFLLAREDGYDSSQLSQHKWAGIALSWLTYGLFLWLKARPQPGPAFHAGTGLAVLTLILAGHWGAAITHGENYILAPLQHQTVAITENTAVYEALIVPILQQKCFSCHNERKVKGGLILTTHHHFAKGGDNGAAFLPGDPGQSLVIQRLELPADHEEHMPPEGKPQLTEAEIGLLRDWIATGADSRITIRDLSADNPLRVPAGQALAKAGAAAEKGYDFKAAPAEKIHALNIPFRTVAPLATGSPALRAAIFIRETYEPRFLEELLAVKEQLVELKLDHLPITDEQLPVIAQFANLEKLNLNQTDISGRALEVLAGCAKLQSLSLAGTPVDTSLAGLLRRLPELKEVFVWNTTLDSSGVNHLRQQFPSIDFHQGYVAEATELLPLSPPVIKRKLNAEGREEIHLLHNFPGAVVRFTTDGSEPDSVHSPAFQEPFALPRFTVIKARAFRDSWLGSPAAVSTYFPQSIPLKKAELHTRPDPKYSGSGALGLTDGQKGLVNNFQSSLWLGYREQPFEALFYPQDPGLAVTSVTISYLQNIGALIAVPAVVEIWGGADAKSLQLLRRMQPERPREYLPNEIKGLEIALPPSNWPCYKVVARPIADLGTWHKAKDRRGWVFVDEVYFYSNPAMALIPGAGDGRVLR